MEKSVKKCPPYHLIVKAVDGNEAAIDRMLVFYDAYICKASLRPLYDEYGNMYLAVDMELRGRIREALMQMIGKFELELN